jgi:hypothetical protein
VRAAIFAVVVALALAGAAAGRVQDERTDAVKVMKVDLAAAITYEEQALESEKNGDEHASHEQLIKGYGALLDAHKALSVLEPDAWEARQYRKLHHVDDPWHRLQDEFQTAIWDDHGALEFRAVDVNIGLALAEKKKMLAFINGASADQCTEVLALRGAMTVNGVAQGHSELRFALSCSEPMKEVDLGLDGEKWSDVEASPGAVKIRVNGEVLEIDLGNVKYVSGTAEATPDFTSGDKIEGEIVPIAGDSAPPVDETM